MHMLMIALMTVLIIVLVPFVLLLGYQWLFARPRPRVPDSADTEGA